LKPLPAAIVRAFVNVAVCPAFTVWVVVPDDVTEKSGGPVTVKFTGADVVPGGTGLTTERG
jgi:hypothetical protein